MINDRFLVNQGSSDSNWPLRLQKRHLLGELGFPIDSNTQPFNSNDIALLRPALTHELSKPVDFLVVISEPVTSTITPLLTAIDGNLIWRDHLGNKNYVSFDKALSLIERLPDGTMVEIAKLPWGSETIGGRLIYESTKIQTIEIQQGLIAPSKILNDQTKPTFVGSLEWLEIDRANYQLWTEYLKSLGFSQFINYGKVRQLCRQIQSHFAGLESLTKVSAMPTIEFSWLENNLTITDVDWPKQWIILEETNG